MTGKYKVAWITGLEPANFLFSVTSNTNGFIYKSDAHFVDIYHTSSGSIIQGFSLSESLGCLDYYPNGALDQPGCSDLPFGAFGNFFSSNRPCVHDRAVLLFGQDFETPDCQMVAYNCSDYDTFLRGKCADCGPNNEHCYLMGLRYDAVNPATAQCYYPSKLFLKTADKPYCLNHYQVVIELGFATPSSGELSGTVCGVSFRDVGDFESHSNHTTLIFSNGPLDSCPDLDIKWVANRGVFGTVLRYPLSPANVDRVHLKFMSHIDRGVRDSKSLSFCPIPKKGSIIQSGKTAKFIRCSPEMAVL
jgi:hypothetical protein